MEADQAGLRCFVAALLESAALEELQAFQKLLRHELPADPFRWSRVDQLHLTLRFLGDMPEQGVEALGTSLQTSLETCGPVQLRLGRPGAFPDLRCPRVLWVDLGGQLDRLCALQTAIERAVRGHATHEESRPFHPHVTLARLRQDAGVSPGLLDRALGRAKAPQPVPFSVREVHVMASELRPTGARYTVLASVPLSGA